MSNPENLNQNSTQPIYVGGMHESYPDFSKTYRNTLNGDLTLSTWPTIVKKTLIKSIREKGYNLSNPSKSPFDQVWLAVDGARHTNTIISDSETTRWQSHINTWSKLPIKPYEIGLPIISVRGDPTCDWGGWYNTNKLELDTISATSLEELFDKVSDDEGNKVRYGRIAENISSIVIAIGLASFICYRLTFSSPKEKYFNRRKFLIGSTAALGTMIVGQSILKIGGLSLMSINAETPEAKEFYQNMMNLFSYIEFHRNQIVDGRTAAATQKLIDAQKLLGNKSPSFVIMGEGHSRHGGRMQYDEGFRRENIVNLAALSNEVVNQFCKSDLTFENQKEQIKIILKEIICGYDILELPTSITPSSKVEELDDKIKRIQGFTRSEMIKEIVDKLIK